MATGDYRYLQDRVLDLIGRSDADTRSRVKNWLNMAQSDFVLRELWPFREATGTLSAAQGTQEYDLSTTFSDLDEQNITSVAIQGTNYKKLIYWPFSQLRADQPDFDLQGQGVPTRYYIKANQIGFWLVPDSAYSIAIDYYKLPTEMSDDADTSIIPLNYRDALIHYALSMEHDYDTDPDLAVKQMNTYEAKLDKARQNLMTQPNDTGAFRIMGPADSVYWQD